MNKLSLRLMIGCSLILSCLVSTTVFPVSLCLNSQLNTQSKQEISAEKTFINLTPGQDYLLSFDVISITPVVSVVVDDGNSIQTLSLTQQGLYSFNLIANSTSIVLSIQSLSGKKQPTSICLDNLLLQAVNQQIVTTIYKEPINDYRYAFNGMEKDDAVSGLGNSYTATFWQYDPRLGRRWNLDPKPNPSISSYAAFANNPVFYSDPKGDTIKGSANAMTQYKGFRDQLLVDIAAVSTKISGKERLLAAASDEDKSGIESSLRTLNTKLGALNDANSELDQLEKSTQVYVFSIMDDANDNRGGFVKYRPALTDNGSKYKDVLHVNVNFGHKNPYAKMAHEFKHAFQWDNFELSINNSTNKDFSFMNLADEIEAYQRQFFFETLTHNNHKPVMSHSDINGEWVLNRSSVYAHLKETAEAQSSISKNTLLKMQEHNARMYKEQHDASSFVNWMSVSNTVYYRGWKKAAGL